MRVNYKDLKTKIKDLLIMRNDDGSYHLFGQYRIEKGANEYTLVHELDETYPKKFFGSLKHAVTYCVFEQHKRKEVKRIEELDSLISSYDVAIAQHKRLAEKSSVPEDKSIFLAKLYEDRLKKTRAMKEITDLVELSKYWQYKRYKENQV